MWSWKPFSSIWRRKIWLVIVNYQAQKVVISRTKVILSLWTHTDYSQSSLHPSYSLEMLSNVICCIAFTGIKVKLTGLYFKGSISLFPPGDRNGICSLSILGTSPSFHEFSEKAWPHSDVCEFPQHLWMDSVNSHRACFHPFVFQVPQLNPYEPVSTLPLTENPHWNQEN